MINNYFQYIVAVVCIGLGSMIVPRCWKNVKEWYDLKLDGAWAVTMFETGLTPVSIACKTLDHLTNNQNYTFQGSLEERKELILFLKCTYTLAKQNGFHMLGWFGLYSPADFYRKNWQGFLQAVEKQNETCSVCLEEVGIHECRVLKCMHVMHRECYREVKERCRSKCPMCRCCCANVLW